MTIAWKRFAASFAAAMAVAACVPFESDDPTSPESGPVENVAVYDVSGEGPTTDDSGYEPLHIPPNATVFYVDAAAGNDGANGRTEVTAWRTIDRVNSAALPAGSFVLFKRGQTFTGTLRPASSGTAAASITLSAYGSGGRPRITSTGYGINLVDRSYFVIRDLDIVQTARSGIRLRNSNTISIYNVYFDGCGRDADPERGGVLSHNGRNITVARITARNTSGEVFGNWGGSNVKVLDSITYPVTSQYADAIQIGWTNGVEIRGNWMEVGGTNSGKGVTCICDSTNVVIANNFASGGNFGLGAYGDHFLIENNWVEDVAGASWSYSIASGGDYASTMTDFVVRNNVVVRGRTGIAAFFNGSHGTKSNFHAYGNTFISATSAFATWNATFTSSDFHHNTLYKTPAGNGVAMYGNQTVASQPSVTRPTQVGRGAF